ncbi:MAG: TlyA family RNA methyltransferase [Armatimonadota bacterium]|nr:TlyA family RNA methyltransferase [Armatimonadota bacterium]MDR7532743.1 TlyA family RNA methyltransferase [Armatimonadota bacterium]MDR7537109.1 TlyA family RNA methyltransferase [Armatimonadota bacterium]
MKTAARVRLDRLVVARGLALSRHQAEAAIRAGEVYVAGRRVDKPGALVHPTAPLERRAASTYVSRGGAKLAGALDAFGLDVAGCVALDVGASTGGFTDCLLQRGARRVYAVDVGRGLLHWRLRRDPRVVVLEGRHAARLRAGDLPEAVDLATVDVSFISVRKVLPAVAALVRPAGLLVLLVKPQFEVGPRAAPGGVVRDPGVHAGVLRATAAAARALGLSPLRVAASPLLGPKGNREFFLLVRNTAGQAAEGLDEEILRATTPAAARVGARGAEP